MNENTQLLNEVIDDVLDGMETRKVRNAYIGKKAKTDIVGIAEKAIIGIGFGLVVAVVLFMMLP